MGRWSVFRELRFNDFREVNMNIIEFHDSENDGVIKVILEDGEYKIKVINIDGVNIISSDKNWLFILTTFRELVSRTLDEFENEPPKIKSDKTISCEDHESDEVLKQLDEFETIISDCIDETDQIKIEMKTTYLTDLILQKEKSLEKREIRLSKTKLNELISEDFTEILGNGEMFGKRDVIKGIIEDTKAGLEYSSFDFEAKQLSGDLGVVLYKTSAIGTDSKPVTCQRSSFWKNEDGVWRNIFHQATRVE